jgi:antitoxin MazE
MKARIQKWGNSLAIRIPKSFAAEAQINQDSLVDISLVNGNVMIVPIVEPEFTLNSLLAGITEENLHQEIEIDELLGNESW